MVNVKGFLRRIVRSLGWELRRLDPDLTLDAYLWFLFRHLSINCVLEVGAGRGEYGDLLRTNMYAGADHLL